MRPILFSGPMVQALLDGRKTVTRRVVHPRVLATGDASCPYGAPGDWLWVKETWAARDVRGDWAPKVRDVDQERDEIVYRTYLWGDPVAPPKRWFSPLHMPRWASRLTLEVVSVRVERLQEITEEDARKEGLDWVSPQPFGERWDDDREDPREVGYPDVGEVSGFARDNFRRLWDQINGERAPWASDPWVWRVEVRRVPW